MTAEIALSRPQKLFATALLDPVDADKAGTGTVMPGMVLVMETNTLCTALRSNFGVLDVTTKTIVLINGTGLVG